MSKFLIIQTAFAGDVILATAVVEKLAAFFPACKIDFLLRKGNESLLSGNPGINEVIVWNKKSNKYRNLYKIINKVRSGKYDYVINLQRFLSSGLLTVMSGVKTKIGFDKNPLSFLFDKAVKHFVSHPVFGDMYEDYSSGRLSSPADGANRKIIHEVDRNHNLIRDLTDNLPAKPKLYPGTADFDFVKGFKTERYICIAPGSVWFTKQFPKEKWIELIIKIKEKIYMLGGKEDSVYCDLIASGSGHHSIYNYAGKLSFLQTAALMKHADMNFVNDSAPIHIASAMNAPVTAVFCSTVPEFGFGPLSDDSKVVETREILTCRPCGLHGYSACPQGHFKCAGTIKIEQFIQSLSQSR